jgi:hypothetical protein
MTDILAELITYHRKKRDWFQYNKEHRQFHEDVLRFLTKEAKSYDGETGELFDE